MSDGLTRYLMQRIAAEGPIPLMDYMADCLMHPQFGYYATRDPLGAGGDFTTAPEISQMFGEMLGVWLAGAWAAQGSPAPFRLVELGPGRGTLMADILRTIGRVPGMSEAADVRLVELSPVLRARQRKALGDRSVHWHDRLQEVPGGPLFLVANEFFDALPVRQFRRSGKAWREVQVGLTDGRLALGLSPEAAVPALAHRLADTSEGDVVELCPALSGIAAEIGRRISRDGGAALVIDYGGWRSRGDTVQAVRNHAAVDPLEDPGSADLTAHVDFEALSAAFVGSGCAASPMTSQGRFLERLGITARADRLAARLTGPALRSHVAAHRRLTHPAEMGDLFKVMACLPPDTPAPPGLDPA